MNRVKQGVNDLATTRPEIAEEWDVELNPGISPSDVTCGSEKKIWWRCKEGHSWQAKVYSRTEGRGCPECAHNRAGLRPGINDLATLGNPKLLAEWDIVANSPLTPEKMAFKSNRKVYWMCSEGHKWQATVVHRSQRGDGCPYCAGIRLLTGFNDLATTHPDIAAEWDYEKNKEIVPTEVMAGAELKAWWKCKEGHGWQAYIYSRKAGTGCPYCAGNILVKGINDLASQRPELLSEWDYDANYPLMPSEVAIGTARKVSWICSLGHKWNAVVSSRALSGRGCPFCTGRKVLIGYNDLKSQNPELTKEWDVDKNGTIRPEQIYMTSHRKVWWKCSAGHSYQASVVNRAMGTGCPYCVGKATLSGFNDFATQCPELVDEWDFSKNGRNPDDVNRWSKQKFWWICKNGHEWKAMVCDRTAGNGCPYCGNRKPIVGETDFQTMNPDLMKEWNHAKNIGVEPSKLTFQTTKIVWWKCKKEHEWRASIYDRRNGTGCPVCAKDINRHTIIPGKNDFASIYPELAKEWDDERNEGITPECIAAKSNRKVWWKCNNGHHWRATPLGRSTGAGCPVCAGKRPIISRLI